MIELERLKNSIKERRAQIRKRRISCIPWAIHLIGAMKELEAMGDTEHAGDLYRIADGNALRSGYRVRNELDVLSQLEEYVDALLTEENTG